MPGVRSRLEPLLGRLYGYALALTQDREQARDLLQDAAVRALQARRPPRDDAAYRAWLFKVLRNLYIDSRRSPAPEPVGAPQEIEAVMDSQTGWQGDESLINEIAVRLAIRKLPTCKREVIALVDIVGFSYAEAAEVLEVPRGTVMSRLSRARGELLSLLEDSNVHALPRARKRGTA